MALHHTAFVQMTCQGTIIDIFGTQEAGCIYASPHYHALHVVSRKATTSPSSTYSSHYRKKPQSLIANPIKLNRKAGSTVRALSGGTLFGCYIDVFVAGTLCARAERGGDVHLHRLILDQSRTFPPTLLERSIGLFLLEGRVRASTWENAY